MELKLSRETLRFERLVTSGTQQVSIEGEATLPGSMRDAVTVLSVQAQAHLSGVHSGAGEVGVRGRMCFQALYTQGDLTRIRALETSCEFVQALPLPAVAAGMRVSAAAAVLETDGSAANGRMTLRARLEIRMDAFETVEKELVTDAQGDDTLQKRLQDAAYCVGQALGSGSTSVREEFPLADKLGVGETLCAFAIAGVEEISGGNGRVGVSGMIEARVLHRPSAPGEPLVLTTHEIPYDLSVEAQLPEGAQIRANAEVVDVMADSASGGDGRILRVEAEVRVTLDVCRESRISLLEDLYSLSGPALEPATETIDVLLSESQEEVRESARIQTQLPKDAPPIDAVLAAFVQPQIAEISPAGRRLNAEGVMSVTLLYLPQDSDIPCAVRTREPFSMTFPAEAGEGVSAQAYAIEAGAGPATSDRAEVRCLLGLRVMRRSTRNLRCVTDVVQGEADTRAHGFVLVWPAPGETRWETASRLRVAEADLRPAGKSALLAFRR